MRTGERELKAQRALLLEAAEGVFGLTPLGKASVQDVHAHVGRALKFFLAGAGAGP